MNVEIVNPIDCPEWDGRVRTLPGASFFHSSHWAHVVSETYGYTPYYFVSKNKEEISAALPIMEVNSWLTGTRGVSLPFTDFCPPLQLPDTSLGDIWEHVKQFGNRSGWKYIELRGGSDMNEELAPSDRYYEHELRLSSDPGDIFARVHKSHKRNIKKAQKVGVTSIEGNSFDSMREFYRLNILTRKAHGLPPQPFSFFSNIQKHIIAKNQGLLLLAIYRERVIAAVMCFHFGDQALYKFGASDNRYQAFRANNLLMWKAIEHYCQRGFRGFHFGRTDEGHGGLRRFKRGWAAEEKKRIYYRYGLKKRDFEENIVKVDGWHTKLFKKMPVPLLRLIGMALSRHCG